jgi:hypothetical protein
MDESDVAAVLMEAGAELFPAAPAPAAAAAAAAAAEGETDADLPDAFKNAILHTFIDVRECAIHSRGF